MSGAFVFEEAAVGILAAVAGADGKFAAEEVAWWRRVQDRHPLFADLPASIFNPMLERARLTMASTPWREAVSRWATDVPPEHRELIFSLAVELAFVDGDVSGQEVPILNHLLSEFGISKERGLQLIRGE